MKGYAKVLLGGVVFIGLATAGLIGAFWWSNIPPKRPQGVSKSAVFLWTSVVGLPAPKHGNWLECWADTTSEDTRCKLTKMDGKLNYEGMFVANNGKAFVPQSDLRINAENTGNTNNFVRTNDTEKSVPLVFLQNGTVLVPKEAYRAGMARLKYLRQVQEK